MLLVRVLQKCYVPAHNGQWIQSLSPFVPPVPPSRFEVLISPGCGRLSVQTPRVGDGYPYSSLISVCAASVRLRSGALSSLAAGAFSSDNALRGGEVDACPIGVGTVNRRRARQVASGCGYRRTRRQIARFASSSIAYPPGTLRIRVEVRVSRNSPADRVGTSRTRRI